MMCRSARKYSNAVNPWFSYQGSKLHSWASEISRRSRLQHHQTLWPTNRCKSSKLKRSSLCSLIGRKFRLSLSKLKTRKRWDSSRNLSNKSPRLRKRIARNLRSSKMYYLTSSALMVPHTSGATGCTLKKSTRYKRKVALVLMLSWRICHGTPLSRLWMRMCILLPSRKRNSLSACRKLSRKTSVES